MKGKGVILVQGKNIHHMTKHIVLQTLPFQLQGSAIAIIGPNLDLCNKYPLQLCGWVKREVRCSMAWNLEKNTEVCSQPSPSALS